jgi:hypothetical protein
MIDRHLYKGYLLSCAAKQVDDGRYQACVGITSMSAQKTRAQRFLDLEFFATESEAAEHARQAGIKWVDDNGAAPSATTALSSSGLPHNRFVNTSHKP